MASILTRTDKRPLHTKLTDKAFELRHVVQDKADLADVLARQSAAATSASVLASEQADAIDQAIELVEQALDLVETAGVEL